MKKLKIFRVDLLHDFGESEHLAIVFDGKSILYMAIWLACRIGHSEIPDLICYLARCLLEDYAFPFVFSVYDNFNRN